MSAHWDGATRPRFEQGQPVGTRLKERQQELDQLRWKLDEPEPLPTRNDFADMLKPLGPLVALGTGDPAGVRSVLRKIGVDRLTLVPMLTAHGGSRVRPTSQPLYTNG